MIERDDGHALPGFCLWLKACKAKKKSFHIAEGFYKIILFGLFTLLLCFYRLCFLHTYHKQQHPVLHLLF